MSNLVVAATIADLPRLAALAGEFSASSNHIRGFNMDRFVAVWETQIGNGNGAIFLLMNGEKPEGMIGGIFYEEIYSGERVATEFFWFVHKDSRGGGIKLYRRFEEWAVENKCVEIRMVLLADSMPDKVANFYERVGYSKVETLYAKRLNDSN